MKYAACKLTRLGELNGFKKVEASFKLPKQALSIGQFYVVHTMTSTWIIIASTTLDQWLSPYNILGAINS